MSAAINSLLPEWNRAKASTNFGRPVVASICNGFVPLKLNLHSVETPANRISLLKRANLSRCGFQRSKTKQSWSNHVGGTQLGADQATILPLDSIQKMNVVMNPKAENGDRLGGDINIGPMATFYCLLFLLRGS